MKWVFRDYGIIKRATLKLPFDSSSCIELLNKPEKDDMLWDSKS